MGLKKKIAFVTLLASLGVMAYAGVNLLATEQVYSEANAIYDELSNTVRGSGTQANAGEMILKTIMETGPSGVDGANGGDQNTANANTAAGTESSKKPKMEVYIPDIGVDFAALRAINNDAESWLYCPETVIDYPVMTTDNYSYYLDHLTDRTKNSNGSLFIDYNCPPDYSGMLTVIYGHHMKSGRMFGSLEKYKKQEYFFENQYMYIYTEAENYRVDLIYGFVIGEGQWRSRAFMYEVNLDKLLDFAELNTTFKSGVQYEEGDRIVALSTCSYEFDDARYVVLGILR